MLSVSATESVQSLDHDSAGEDDDILACPNNDSNNEREAFDRGWFCS